jgi:C-terminal processing protease CtpA/Prc
VEAQMRVWIVLLLIASAGPAQDVQSLYQRREAERSRLWREKRYDEAVGVLQEMAADPALTAVPEIRANIWYNLACGYALTGKALESIAMLRRAIDEMAVDPAKLERDGDFANVRRVAAFAELMKVDRKKWEAQKRLWDSPAMRTPYRENLGEDEKVAGLVRFWSEAKYNFAWFDKLINFDWDAKMMQFLPRVRAARNAAEYYRVLMEFGALLNDSHTGVSPPPEARDAVRSWPGLRLALVERRVLVSEVFDDALTAAGVKRGTELTAVDGLPVWEYAGRFVFPLEGASTDQDRERRAVTYDLLGGAKGTEVRLGFADEARKFEVRAARAEATRGVRIGDRPTFVFRTLDGGRVAYVAMNTFADQGIVPEFEKAWPEIRKAPALILDVRENGGGNSGLGAQILGYLVRNGGPVAATRTRVYRPAYRAWGYPEGWENRTWNVEAKVGEGYGGRMALLVGPGTFSAAEDFASSFDGLDAGTLIGEPTGGSTGQPLMFPLPGGGMGRVCTLQERYADGREFVGVGIQPKVRVAQTVADFRAGRDKVLERAVEYLRR